jgi:hypothetical protein
MIITIKSQSINLAVGYFLNDACRILLCTITTTINVRMKSWREAHVMLSVVDGDLATTHIFHEDKVLH